MKATKRELQSLLGKLFHIAKCVRSARLFLGRLLAVLRSAPVRGYVNLSHDCQLDIAWFKACLETQNGVSMLHHEHVHGAGPSVHVESCLSGCGGIFLDMYYGRAFPADIVKNVFPHFWA